MCMCKYTDFIGGHFEYRVLLLGGHSNPNRNTRNGFSTPKNPKNDVLHIFLA